MRAVILAGGKGTRLHPYTVVFPKPLVPVDDMPILEIVLRQLKASGITRVTIAVGHLAHLLQAFFGDGKALGLEIDYAIEDTPLGTAGPLSNIHDLDDTFLVMNGDILTNLNYGDLIRQHRQQGAMVSIASYHRQVTLDFGVIETNADTTLRDYVEKPTFEYLVSMGIYVFEPEVLSRLKPNKKFDFPDLVKLLIAEGQRVRSYAFDGYWLDIGRPDDYATATEQFQLNRAEFYRDF